MPLPSWRTGTTAQPAHGCKSTARPAGRGSLFITPPGKQPDACPSRCRTSRRAQCSRRLSFSCGGHATVPISSGLGWLLMSDVWFETRGAAREPRGVGRFVGVLGVFRGRSSADCASWFVSGWEALRGQIWPIVRPSSLRGRRGRVGV
jgi:hypothetical protein